MKLRPIHLLRYGLPGAIAVLGVAAFCFGTETGDAIGVSALCVAVIVVGVNLFARMTLASQSDREREERAREQYARTGRWEPPPPPSPAGRAGPAGLPLAKPRPPRVRPPAVPPETPPRAASPPDGRDPHDPGHRAAPGPGSERSRRPLSARPRPRRPD